MGAAVAVVVAVPVATAGGVSLDDGAGAAVAFGIVALAGFLAGGWVAGWRSNHGALANGALAALAGFAVAQVVALVVGSSGEGTDVADVVVYALLATSLGLVGGWLADRRP
jgi:hypothetical protein